MPFFYLPVLVQDEGLFIRFAGEVAALILRSKPTGLPFLGRLARAKTTFAPSAAKCFAKETSVPLKHR
jgi:hypothetical protein